MESGASQAPGRALIVHVAGLGDLVCAVPALSAMVRGWPSCRFTFAGDPPARDVIGLAGLGVELVPLADPPYRGLWDRTVKPERGIVPDFDLVMETWTCGRRGERYTAMTGGRFVPMPCDPGSATWGPMVYRTWRWACTTFGLRVLYEAPKLDAGRDRFADVAAYLHGRGIHAPYVVLCPGAGTEYKCWPEPCWWELGRRLQAEAGVQVVGNLGPRETGRGVVIPDDVANFVSRDWSLVDFSALVAGAACYVGNDGGQSHVATWTVGGSAGHVPAVLAFCRLNRLAWAPRVDWVTVLEMPTHEPSRLSVDEMMRAVLGMLA